MPTSTLNRDAQLSTLANAAYLDNPPTTIGSWTRVGDPYPTSSGFFGVAYYNADTKQVVVSFRGTDGKGDLSADTNFTTGGWSQQFTDAAAYTKQVQDEIASKPLEYPGGATMLTTGHSLGGGISQIIAKMFGLDGSSYEAPGASSVTDNPQFATIKAQYASDSTGNIGTSFTNYRAEGSFISSVGTTLGQTQNMVNLTDAGAVSFASAALAIAGVSAGGLGGLVASALGVTGVNVDTHHSMDGMERTMYLAAGLENAIGNGSVKMDIVPLSQATGQVWTGAGNEPQVTVFKDANNQVTAYIQKDGSGWKLSTPDQQTTITLNPTSSGQAPICTVKEPSKDAYTCVLSEKDGAITRSIDSNRDGAIDQNRTLYDDGSTLTTTNYPDGKQSVVSVGTDGTSKQVDYTVPADPNVQTITLKDPNGNVLSTKVFTQTLDEQNNPVPNSYDILQKDANGVITATGQRTLNPTDGSYTDAVFGSITAQNPTGTLTIQNTDAKGVTQTQVNANSLSNLDAAATGFNDARAIYKAIQAGNKAGITQGVLNGASDYSNFTTGSGIAGSSLAANGIGAMLSLQGLDKALHQGDGLAALSSAANTITATSTAYANSLGYASQGTSSALDQALASNEFGSVSGVVSEVAADVPYLSIAVDLEHGNYIGAAAAAIGMYMGGPIGAAVGSIIGDIFGDLWGDSPPAPWGSANAHWDNASGTIVISAVGESSGDTVVYNELSSLEGALYSVANSYNAQTQPNLHIGLIPQRLGSLSYRGGQYSISTVDPVTGAQLNPNLYFDSTGAVAGSYQSNAVYFQSLNQYYINNALALQALAPDWEVQTAKLQAANGQSNAGLSELERAANQGHLAAPLAAGATTEIWNPIALDLGGGLSTTSLSASGVQFNVDGTDNLDANLTGQAQTQYLHQTAWLNHTDGFLVLDENLNGTIDNGQELFSNSQVAGGYRGVASLGTWDINGNHVIDASDPIFSQLGIWVDANSDGKMSATEFHSLTSLGITGLNYGLGTYTKTDGSVHQMSTLSLQANAVGNNYTPATDGIKLNSSNGQTTVYVTQVHNLSKLQANDESVTTDENAATVISVRGNGTTLQGLLDTSQVSNAPNALINFSGVSNAQNGTVSYDAQAGTVTFTPTANYHGTDAGFDYQVSAGAYGTATAHVQINVDHNASSDVAPHIVGEQNTQNTVYDDATQTYSTVTDPYSGTVSVTDVDDPVSSLTWSIVNQGLHGSASINANGAWVFTGAQSVGGTDAFTVQVTDPLGKSDTMVITVPLPAAPSGDGGSGGDGGGDGASSDGASSDGGSADGGAGDGGGDGGGGGGDGGGDPLILDLNRSGFHFTSVDDSNVFFTQEGDGLRHKTAWFSGGNGVLAYDKFSDGVIHDSSQINFQDYLPGSLNALQGLAAFDSNHDGVINSQDSLWSKLGVWVDSNSNGVSETGEFKSLSSLGIASLSLSGANDFSVQNGVVIQSMATFTLLDGSSSQMADVTLPLSNQVLALNPDGSTRVATVAQGSVNTPAIYDDGNNLIEGDVGDNNIQAGNGANVISTGSGNDLIKTGNGNNTIMSGGGQDVISVGSGDNTIYFGSGAKTLFTGAGNNTIVGGSGNSIVMAGNGNNTIYAGTGNSVLDAGNGANTLIGGTGYNELIVGNGNNILTDGGGRADMTAGTGSNTFVVNNVLDTITVAATTGTNTVKSSVNWTLGANQQILWGTGNATLTLTGNDQGDQLIGNGAADTLIGGAGNDILADSGGAATLRGGLGDDTYIVSNTNTVVVETSDAGNDTIKSSVNYTLAANVQTLIGTGNAALTLTGGNQDGVIIQANNANDTLVAGSGVATLIGGSGNDTFVVNNVNDVVQAKSINGNVNTIQSSVSYTASANVQNLTGTGSADITLTGNSLAHTITANSGNTTLVAGSGVATLIGGSGNDTYRLFNTSGTVVLGSGQSTVTAGDGTYAVTGNVSGTSSMNFGDGSNAIDLSMNRLANTVAVGHGTNTILIGDGNNTVTTGHGSNTITLGGGTNTLLTQDAAGSVNTVSLGSGRNTVTLASGNNKITTTDAVGGLDTISAGNGNNTLVLGQGNDVVTLGNGANSVTSGDGANQITLGTGSNHVTLGAGANHVTAIDVSGAVDTLALGNGNNQVSLGDGNDTLAIGNGNNTITTGNGSSTVQVGNGINTIQVGNGANQVTTGSGTNAIHIGTGSDTIVNNGGVDNLYFDDGVTADSLTFSQSGDDLLIVEGMTGGRVRIVGGYKMRLAAINQFIASNGSYAIQLDNASYNFAAGNGNNVAVIGNGANTLSFGNGTNTLRGSSSGAQGGNHVSFGTGSNTVTLGNGANTLVAQDTAGAVNTIKLGSGRNTVNLGQGNNKVSTTDLAGGLDVISAGNGNNTIAVWQGNNHITLGNGANSVSGGNGANTVSLGSGSDSVTLGNGANMITSLDIAGSKSVIHLGSGDNNLSVGQGDNSILATNGSNTVVGGNGANTVVMGTGQNTITLGNGANKVTTADVKGVSNTIRVGDGSNQVSVNQGSNTITAGNGANTVTANGGSNTVHLGSGSNNVVLGDGTDVVTAQDVTGSSNTVTLSNGNDLVTLANGNNTVVSGNGNNHIVVGDGNNSLTVGRGANKIITGSGSNDIYLGLGNNTITNHGGVDRLHFSPNWVAGSLSFSQSGNDLLIREGFTGGYVHVVGGYNNPAAAMSQFIAGNGNYSIYLDEGVTTLLQVMGTTLSMAETVRMKLL